MKKCLPYLTVFGVVIGMAWLAGCQTMPGPSPSPSASPTPTPTASPSPSPQPVDQFETVRKALDDYFSSDPPPVTTAQNVFDLINDGDDVNDPYILSVRSGEHYAIGHVPGAANIPWRTIANEGVLADVPTDQQVVVYCYTGHTGAAATLFLNAAGYNAVNMKYGINAWTRNAEVRVVPAFNQETDGNDFPTVTEATPTQTFELPDLDVTDSTDEAEIIRAAGEAYFGGTAPPTISAPEVFDLLNDGDDANDPFIISVRGADHYALGHIEGAINIPWKMIAKVENLEKIPSDRQIVVYCYTGHTGGLATTALTMLGYNAVNMKFGIVAWTTDPDIRATSAFSEETDANDFPVEPPIDDGNGGGGEGSVAEGQAFYSANCAACHGSDGSNGFAPNISGFTTAELDAGLESATHGAITFTDDDLLNLAAFLSS